MLRGAARVLLLPRRARGAPPGAPARAASSSSASSVRGAAQDAAAMFRTLPESAEAAALLASGRAAAALSPLQRAADIFCALPGPAYRIAAQRELARLHLVLGATDAELAARRAYGAACEELRSAGGGDGGGGGAAAAAMRDVADSVALLRAGRAEEAAGAAGRAVAALREGGEGEAAAGKATAQLGLAHALCALSQARAALPAGSAGGAELALAWGECGAAGGGGGGAAAEAATAQLHAAMCCAVRGEALLLLPALPAATAVEEAAAAAEAAAEFSEALELLGEAAEGGEEEEEEEEEEEGRERGPSGQAAALLEVVARVGLGEARLAAGDAQGAADALAPACDLGAAGVGAASGSAFALGAPLRASAAAFEQLGEALVAEGLLNNATSTLRAWAQQDGQGRPPPPPPLLRDGDDRFLGQPYGPETAEELHLSLLQAADLLGRMEWNGKSREPEGALLLAEAGRLSEAAGGGHWGGARRRAGSWMTELLGGDLLVIG